MSNPYIVRNAESTILNSYENKHDEDNTHASQLKTKNEELEVFMKKLLTDKYTKDLSKLEQDLALQHDQYILEHEIRLKTQVKVDELSKVNEKLEEEIKTLKKALEISEDTKSKARHNNENPGNDKIRFVV